MSNQSSAIVQRLWNYCTVLRDDGLSYGDYVEQLTYLLFLKMDDERRKIDNSSTIPKGQKRISDEIERRGSVAAVTQQAITANLTRAHRLRQAILQKAFTGQLVPQAETGQSLA